MSRNSMWNLTDTILPPQIIWIYFWCQLMQLRSNFRTKKHWVINGRDWIQQDWLSCQYKHSYWTTNIMMVNYLPFLASTTLVHVVFFNYVHVCHLLANNILNLNHHMASMSMNTWLNKYWLDYIISIFNLWNNLSFFTYVNESIIWICYTKVRNQLFCSEYYD